MRKQAVSQTAKIEASRLSRAAVVQIRFAEVEAEIVASHTQVCKVRRAAKTEAIR